ncbi:EAL domain-containing protein [Herbaspirillum sp.]|jgi:EAL domain-containing protein (putative c-di-GMP-specific phosphodiesterase class I)|uniref:EAL domain-containing protein n=1 Tax=Herbaspirillum TaxID=963 RepID=UPI002586D163|nr:EAL domain-containing protein [Herbaspirillum sp.]MCP3657624.1 EAL domain-containing protein [Herbaspirillum sp.]MCP3949796.1 EAL domain-containing protein [Herbaspirillum sp.]MCP4035047.1 EAL domain-containing protein [Herbaspirillum sp.]MCP4556526.1 EAL domain-containing protein [Herbaspirillum sp.]
MHAPAHCGRSAAVPPMDRRHLLLALRRREFQPFLQPIVGEEGDWQGAEILMRWQHPHAGMLAPAIFLERLSEEGLLAATTHQMLQQVRTSWGSAPACLRQPFVLSFNACGEQLQGESLVAQCQALLRRLPWPQLQLMIEMPERGADLGPERCRRLFAQCERADIAIALDDFGIGDARLHQLACGRVSCLKLDRSFVAAMQGNSLYSRLIETIVSLAAEFDATVTAEGIETRGQWQRLRRMGVRRFQGYYFARPLAMPEFFRQMQRRRGQAATN